MRMMNEWWYTIMIGELEVKNINTTQLGDTGQIKPGIYTIRLVAHKSGSETEYNIHNKHIQIYI